MQLTGICIITVSIAMFILFFMKVIYNHGYSGKDWDFYRPARKIFEVVLSFDETFEKASGIILLF